MKARIRSVKPEVHLDEELWDLEQSTGLPIFRTWIGLWNFADREGRFEWRARALKAVILPYWDGDFEQALAALEGSRFIRRYESDGKTYGVIRTFTRHQLINNREEASSLPAPPRDTDACPTRGPRVPDASPTRPALDLDLDRNGSRSLSGSGSDAPPREEQKESQVFEISERRSPDSTGAPLRMRPASERTEYQAWEGAFQPPARAIEFWAGPNETHQKLAKHLRYGGPEEHEKFRDHVRRKGLLSRDWDAEFSFWLRTGAEMAAERRAARPPGLVEHESRKPEKGLSPEARARARRIAAELDAQREKAS